MALRAVSSALVRSVSITTICSGARIGSGPRISRACAVCSTGTK